MTKAPPGLSPAGCVTCFQAPPHPHWVGVGVISDIVWSSRIFFLPTLSESIFVVSAANRASLVSKYSWCGRPGDLERDEHSSGAKGVQGKDSQETRRPCAGWEALPGKGLGGVCPKFK